MCQFSTAALFDHPIFTVPFLNLPRCLSLSLPSALCAAILCFSTGQATAAKVYVVAAAGDRWTRLQGLPSSLPAQFGRSRVGLKAPPSASTHGSLLFLVQERLVTLFNFTSMAPSLSFHGGSFFFLPAISSYPTVWLDDL
jgi:hypothetical protein